MNQNFIFFDIRKNRGQNYLIAILLFIGASLAGINRVSAQYQTSLKAVTKSINTYIGGYQESLPNDYATNTSKKYPLLIFIHGKGECGTGSQTDLAKVTRVGIGYNLKAGKFPASFTVNGESFSFIVIAPQITTSNYSSVSSYMGSLIDYCKKTYRVDETRIYMTGLSMGGGITWRYAGSNASQLAAVVPVCGSVAGSTTDIKNIASSNLPVWATHNSNDPTVNVSVTKNWIASLSAYVPTMNPLPLMTIFTAASHDAWTKTYDINFKVNNKNIFQWMLSYKRGTSTPSQYPTANAGTAQSVTLPTNSVTLDASGSTTPSGTTISSYSWTKTSGGSATISSPSSAKTTVTGLAQGTYVFSLAVKNSAGLTSTSSVTVTVNAAPAPAANAGADAKITLPTTGLTLDGSGSTTPSGTTITSYLWAKISGGAATISTPTSVSTTVKGLEEGTYVFSLTITNSAGAKATDNVTVVVNPATSTVVTPVANAGADAKITLPTSGLTLNGSGSTAAGTTITSYLWTKVSGGTATISSPTTPTTTVKGMEAGTYVFALKVTNNTGGTATDNVTVVVNPESNTVVTPVANAGADAKITLPTSGLTLNGSGSTASGTTITGYLWTKVSGGAATISSPTTPSTTVKGMMEAGTYVFALTVTNNTGGTATDNVTVVVNPGDAPVANAGSNQTITLPTNSVTLDGSASTASSGTITSYSWTKTSGGSVSITSPGSAKTSVTGLSEGSYTFKLTVTNSVGSSSSATVSVTVASSSSVGDNVSPIADAGADKTIILPTSSVSLDGSGSVAQVGRIISYAWSQVSGAAATIISPSSAKTTVSGLAKGEYIFSLLVTSDNGKRTADEVKITVVESSSSTDTQSPIADAGSDKSITLPASSVTVDGSASVAQVGRIISYAWSQVSGAAATIVSAGSAKTSITGLTAGTYLFELLVIADNGKRSTDQVKVTVNSATSSSATSSSTIDPSAPVADAGSNKTITLPTSSVTLDGSASFATVGRIISYEWSQLSGGSAKITSPSAAVTSITGLTQGVYQFSLLVTSDNGRRTSADVTVTVNSSSTSARVASSDNVTDQSVATTTVSPLLADRKIDLAVSPNPATSNITLRLNSLLKGKTSVLIYSLQGNVVHQVEFTKDNEGLMLKEINVSKLSRGIYILSVSIGGQLKQTARFIKQ